ncbi:hypothetical protein QUF75_15625 [Desulfococcaceae bacterium HSG7]|nr:hypothetical protein [Desulfococcaceae bacterium HSG7]
MPMQNIDIKASGAPDISLSGLKIWISGRQFEDSTDFQDANWLVVTARCSSYFSEVLTQGPIIHLSELELWMAELLKLNETICGEADLNCMEPELSASIRLDKNGSGTLTVFITPDNMNEQHRFTFAIVQSYLPSLIRELQTVLTKYPIKGSCP